MAFFSYASRRRFSRLSGWVWLTLALYIAANLSSFYWAGLQRPVATKTDDSYITLCTATGIVHVAAADIKGAAENGQMSGKGRGEFPPVSHGGPHCPLCLVSFNNLYLPTADFSSSLPVPTAKSFLPIVFAVPRSRTPDLRHAPTRAPPFFSFA
jgi:hypothetical protein